MAATDEISERLQKATIASHPLLCRLNEIGNIKSFEGGRTIIQEIAFPVLVEPNQFPPFTWYGGYEVLKPGQWKPANNLHQAFQNHEVSGVFTAAEYPIQQAAVAFHEDKQEIDPVAEAAKMTAQAISSGGGRNSINSLPDLVSITPTIGMVGGIDRKQHRFWRNLSISYRSGQKLSDVMGLMIEKLSIVEYVGSTKLERPDLILMGKDDFNDFKKSLPDGMLKSKYSDWGFESLDFGETAVVLDPSLQSIIENHSVIPSRIYFLHTKYFRWRFYAGRNWKKIDQDRFFAEATRPMPDIYAWAGNLTMSCSYVHGVLHRY